MNKTDENMNITDVDDDVNDKIEKFTEKFHKHGLGCGQEIAELVKTIHPNAACVIPLYRSCIAITQNDIEKSEGSCTLHMYADPHWLGGEINLDNLKSGRFYIEFNIKGYREGPAISKK